MKTIKPGSTIGIIGGGQLGRMSAMAAANLGLHVHVYSDYKDCPAKQVVDKVFVAPFDDIKALEKFAKTVDIITFEFENIPHKSVQALEKHCIVRPNWKVLSITQNRIREKEFLNEIGLKTAPYRKITSAPVLSKAYKEIGPKCILKTLELGYDGKGQHIIDENSRLAPLWKEAKMGIGILEGFVDYKKELSVVIARDVNGGTIPYMPVENIHKNGILDTTIAPAEIEYELMEECWEIAHLIAEKIDIVGILAVEMFLTKKNEILINELAPRPHNSGHWTMDGCLTSQFENFIRAVCGLPLGATDYHSKCIMKNMIGEQIQTWNRFISDPDSKIHIYGKKEAREGRKMGHVTHLISEEDVLIDN